MFIDKPGYFLLAKDQLDYFFKLGFYFWGNTVNVDQQIFIFKVGASEIEEEGSESKVDSRFIGLVEEGDEVAIVVDFSFVFIVPIHPFFVCIQYLFAKDLRIAEQGGHVLFLMLPVIFG